MMTENIIPTEILNVLPLNIREILLKAVTKLASGISEVCLRTNKPIILRCSDGFYFLTSDGTVTKLYRSNVYIAGKKEINETFLKMCGYSVHSRTDEIRKGYLTLAGGHRVGICGTAVTENGSVSTVKDISSLNIRISHEVPNCALNIMKEFYFAESRPPGLLIAGPPMSGKTTVLRDLCCRLSGNVIDGCRIALIDEREEIAGTYNGEAGYNVGVNVDILSGYPKAEAIQTAVRCFSPQLIMCDEVSTSEEALAVLEGMNTGVEFILTVHAFDKYDLIKRPCVKTLLKSEAFENVIILSGRDSENAVLFEQYKGSELLNEINGNYFSSNRFDICGSMGSSQMQKAN